MTAPDRATLVATIDRLVAQLLPEAYVVEVQVHSGRSRRLEVLADTDRGIRLQQVTLLNRGLREGLEATPATAWVADYELAVASPGVGNPLKVSRQYAGAVGRTLELRLTTGEELVATLVAYAEPTLTLSYVARNPTTKKKETLTRSLDRADVARAVVQVSFADGPKAPADAAETELESEPETL